MELSDLKLVTAGNIINLRTARGLTQAELGAKLNYSDKTISKWERGEAIPDAYVLTQMAELFGVTVDELPGPSYSVEVLISLVLIGVFTAGLAVFVTLWMLGIIEWRVFLVTLSVGILVYMILDCVFLHARHLQYILGAFVLSLFVLVYFFLHQYRPWQLFLVAVPAEVLVFLGCNLRRRPHRRKNGKKP